jgi:hypothetical protein
MAVTLEDIEQIKIIEWIKQCSDLPVIHIANQRKTSAQHGALLKRMGVRAGAADLFLPRSNGIHSGLWIELKTLSGKPTKLQLDFLVDMIKEGYSAKVCYGAEHAIDLIKKFYNMA